MTPKPAAPGPQTTKLKIEIMQAPERKPSDTARQRAEATTLKVEIQSAQFGKVIEAIATATGIKIQNNLSSSTSAAGGVGITGSLTAWNFLERLAGIHKFTLSADKDSLVLASASPAAAEATDAPPQLMGKLPAGKLAFVRLRGTDRQSTIYVLNPASALSKIWEGKSGQLSWTRDGKKLLHGSYQDRKILDLDKQAMTNAPATVPGDFSPDGTMLVSATFDYKTQLSTIQTQAIDGTNNKVLITGEFGLRDARWSPDGKKIIFTSNQKGPPGANNVWVMNADGTGQVNLSNNREWSDFPSWSPDGTRVLWTSRTTGDGPFSITVAKADGTGQTKIEGRKMEMNPPLKFEIRSSDTSPTWSPDGKWIAFASVTNPPSPATATTGIWLMKVDGSMRTEILRDATGLSYPSLSWSR